MLTFSYCLKSHPKLSSNKVGESWKSSFSWRIFNSRLQNRAFRRAVDNTCFTIRACRQSLILRFGALIILSATSRQYFCDIIPMTPMKNQQLHDPPINFKFMNNVKETVGQLNVPAIKCIVYLFLIRFSRVAPSFFFGHFACFAVVDSYFSCFFSRCSLFFLHYPPPPPTLF